MRGPPSTPSTTRREDDDGRDIVTGIKRAFVRNPQTNARRAPGRRYRYRFLKPRFFRLIKQVCFDDPKLTISGSIPYPFPSACIRDNSAHHEMPGPPQITHRPS